MGDSNSRPDGPKPPALPTALIPAIDFFRFQEVFLSVVIYVVKPAFRPGFTGGKNRSNISVPTGSAVSALGAWDTPPMLPKQARYQLRYTRLFSFELLYHAAGENQSFSCQWSLMWSTLIFAADHDSTKNAEGKVFCVSCRSSGKRGVPPISTLFQTFSHPRIDFF